MCCPIVSHQNNVKEAVRYIFKKGSVLGPSLQMCKLKTCFESTEILKVMSIKKC